MTVSPPSITPLGDRVVSIISFECFRRSQKLGVTLLQRSISKLKTHVHKRDVSISGSLTQESRAGGLLILVGDIVSSSFSSRHPIWSDEDVTTTRALPCSFAVSSSLERRTLVSTKAPTTFVAKMVSMPCGERV